MTWLPTAAPRSCIQACVRTAYLTYRRLAFFADYYVPCVLYGVTLLFVDSPEAVLLEKLGERSMLPAFEEMEPHKWRATQSGKTFSFTFVELHTNKALPAGARKGHLVDGEQDTTRHNSASVTTADSEPIALVLSSAFTMVTLPQARC